MTFGGFVLFIVVLIGSVILAWQNPSFQSWAISKLMLMQQPGFAEDAESAPAPLPQYKGFEGRVADMQSIGDVYRITNVWNVHLSFTETQWSALGPNRIAPVSGWLREQGRPVLRNTNAMRSGLAGVVGFDFPWSAATVEFGGMTFTNAGVRIKGNGTFLASMGSFKHPYKVSLDHHVKGQKLLGKGTFNFGNLGADFSGLADALGYEFHREAGVHAPRTAFARMFLTIEGREKHRLLGLYVMAENPDETWAKERFGRKGAALFKPVTYELFSDLGTNWTQYAGIYDPKTKMTPEQEERCVRIIRFVANASAEEFAAGIAQHLDLEETARFFACETLLSNYDGIYTTGQNFLMYLDPRTDRMGFIPWDLDHSWGEAQFIGNTYQREHSDIWQPWVGKNRFLERLFSAPPFRAAYRKELERLLATQFIPARLAQRVDALAPVIRPLLAEASTNRLKRFDIAVSSKFSDGPRETDHPDDPHRPVWQIKRFVENRAKSVRDQLDGKVKGVRVHHQAPKDTQRETPDKKKP
jgi:hypothetical protein